MCVLYVWGVFCLFKQKTAYDMRISDWSSDVCSSDLADGADMGEAAFFLDVVVSHEERVRNVHNAQVVTNGTRTSCCAPIRLRPHLARRANRPRQIGRASCRERVCQYV